MITLTTFGAILCSLYRGIRMLLLKKKSMFSLKYGKQDSTKVRDQLVELSSFSRNDYGLETNIVDPNNYIKQLNKIIDKGMLKWFFFVPYCTINIVTLVVIIIIYAGDHINIFEKCINISESLFYPITFFGALILIILPFAHINLIKLKFKSRWNLRTEMLINTSLLGAGLIIYGLSRIYTNYSSATLIGISLLMGIFCFIQFNTVVIPLLEIKKEKEKKKSKDYKSIDEFILSLENKSFLELLKEKAMENFCIENVLFWEAYYDLMLNIKEYYLKSGKKYNNNNIVNSSIYESENHMQEDKSEIIENSQTVKNSFGNNITKESVLETDQYSTVNNQSNFDINDDKTSIIDNFNSACPIKEIYIQNNNPSNTYSPSPSYNVKQGNFFLNSSEKLSNSNSPNSENLLLNKHSIVKNESQNNAIQTSVKRAILSEDDIKSFAVYNENEDKIIDQDTNLSNKNNKNNTEINKNQNHINNNNNNNNSDNDENNSLNKSNHSNGNSNNNSTPKSKSNEFTVDITELQIQKPEVKRENSYSLERQSIRSGHLRREGSSFSYIGSPISPRNGIHSPLSHRTSHASNEIVNFTSITSKHSENNMNEDHEGNKNHIVDISKIEKSSNLLKFPTKDKENEIHPMKKKSNTATINNSKSLLKYIKSLTLYNCEFDPKFKPLFDQIYYLYIYKDGIAPVILSLSTLTTISNRIDNEDYSYDMYQSAIEEVINILYMNIYPKIE
jgi:hypothetical protein